MWSVREWALPYRGPHLEASARCSPRNLRCYPVSISATTAGALDQAPKFIETQKHMTMKPITRMVTTVVLPLHPISLSMQCKKNTMNTKRKTFFPSTKFTLRRSARRLRLSAAILQQQQCCSLTRGAARLNQSSLPPSATPTRAGVIAGTRRTGCGTPARAVHTGTNTHAPDASCLGRGLLLYVR